MSKATAAIRAEERLDEEKSQQKEFNELSEQLFNRGKNPLQHH